MTEAEAITAFQYYLAHNYDNAFFLFTLMTAFLFMSYFVAHKLNFFLSAVVLFLFSAWAFMAIWGAMLVTNDIAALYGYIIEQKTAGNFDIPWFGSNSDRDLYVGDLIGGMAYTGGYIASIIFFFYRKYRGGVD